MSNVLSSLFLLIILTGCLGKLETLTGDTHSEVRLSNEKIERSHYEAKISQLITWFGSRDLDEATRKSAFIKLLEVGPDSLYERPLLFGASLPLTPRYFEIDKGFPNVTYVSRTEVHSSRNKLTTVDFKKLDIMRKGCLSFFELLLNKIRQQNDSNDLLIDQGVRSIRICSAVFGAIPFNVNLEEMKKELIHLENNFSTNKALLDRTFAVRKQKQSERTALKDNNKIAQLSEEISKLTADETALFKKLNFLNEEKKRTSGEKAFFNEGAFDKEEGISKIREVLSSLPFNDNFKNEVKGLLETKLERNEILFLYNWKINQLPSTP